MSKTLNLFILASMVWLLTGPIAAWAGPQIEVTMASAREVTEMVDGREVKKMVPADSVEPGQILQFTLRYTNKGDEKATRVVIDNPLPKDAVYLIGSVAGLDSEILFSIDGGKKYKQPSLLSYEMKEPDGRIVKKTASPEQYTDIRWVIAEILPGQQGEVSFRARVK